MTPARSLVSIVVFGRRQHRSDDVDRLARDSSSAEPDRRGDRARDDDLFPAVLRAALLLNRQAGAIGIPDLLVVVLIVEATTDALGRNESVTEAAVLICTVMFWSYGLQWLAYRFPRLEFLVSSPQVKLVENGKMLRKNMRRELVTEAELESLLRTQGVDDLSRVKLACLESSGDISVVTFDNEQTQGGHRNRARDAA